MKILIENSGIKAEIEVDDDTKLPDTVGFIEHLLKTVGYCFSGHLDIIEEDKRN